MLISRATHVIGRRYLSLVVIPLLVLGSGQYLQVNPPQVRQIQHVIVIMKENHTFDNYFGTYPGLPKGMGLNLTTDCSWTGARETGKLVCPYHLTNPGSPLDMGHDWTTAHSAWNSGKMDEFAYAEYGNNTMGYFNGNDIPYYWDYASQYVLADNYFSSVMGPSDPNHSYLMFGTSWNHTADASWFNVNMLIKNQTASVFTELKSRNLAYSVYGGSTSNPGGPLFSDIADGKLANVTYIIPDDTGTTNYSEHPTGSIILGMEWSVQVINAIMQSKFWSTSAVFLTWDDYGGYYDHVPPPQVDNMGYGFRVPLLIISPYAKQGYVDGTLNDHTSILKFVQSIFDLPGNLTSRDAEANNLMEAFNFGQDPRPPVVLPGGCIPDKYPLTPSGCQNQQSSSPWTNLESPEIGLFLLVSAAVVIVVVAVTLGHQRSQRIGKPNDRRTVRQGWHRDVRVAAEGIESSPTMRAIVRVSC